jgi:hypothetical protein
MGGYQQLLQLGRPVGEAVRVVIGIAVGLVAGAAVARVSIVVVVVSAAAVVVAVVVPVAGVPAAVVAVTVVIVTPDIMVLITRKAMNRRILGMAGPPWVLQGVRQIRGFRCRILRGPSAPSGE